MPLISLHELGVVMKQLLTDYPDGRVAVSQLGNLVIVSEHEAVAWVLVTTPSPNGRIVKVDRDSPFAAMPTKQK